jgi:hypothetical protein
MGALNGTANEQLIRWMARAWAGVLFIFWGMFFVEHTMEWFTHPGAFPSPFVWALQVAHLALLAGLVIGWRWELAGGIVTLVSAIVFFGYTAGPRAITFIAVTSAPAVIWIALGLRARRSPLRA